MANLTYLTYFERNLLPLAIVREGLKEFPDSTLYSFAYHVHDVHDEPLAKYDRNLTINSNNMT